MYYSFQFQVNIDSTKFYLLCYTRQFVTPIIRWNLLIFVETTKFPLARGGGREDTFNSQTE